MSQHQVRDASGQRGALQERDRLPQRERPEDGRRRTEARADQPHSERGSEGCPREAHHG